MTMTKNIFAVLIAGFAPLFLIGSVGAPVVAGLWVGLAAAVLVLLVLRVPLPPLVVPSSQETEIEEQRPNQAEQVLGTLPDPVILIDEKDRVCFANAAAQAIYPGFESGVLLSVFVRHPEVLALAARARKKGGPHALRFALRRPAPRFLRVVALTLGDGQYALVFQDETELHHAEHLRAGFLANVSHELRTPLASLSGYIETLSGHAKDDAQARDKFLGIMADQAGRMGRLIDDILSLSRIEMDEHQVPRDHVDLNAVIIDVVDALAPVAKGRDVTLFVDLPDIPVPVIGERDQLIQIVQNLIDNAIKYTPRGKKVEIILTGKTDRQSPDFVRKAMGDTAPRLHIVEAPRSGVQDFAMLRIRDSGPGIDDQHLPRLGERFYRVEDGKTAERSGTGLGLAIVKHIVNRHRGALSVQSKPGLGTVFTVALPRR